jgi:hypothetical protein
MVGYFIIIKGFAGLVKSWATFHQKLGRFL